MRYRRNYVEGGTYFFTVNLHERDKTFLIDRIEALRQAVRYVKRSRPFVIDAWVVLPDHLHAIWSLPEGDADFSGRWREVKKRFSKSISQTETGERRVWQRRFWEHTIRNELDYQHHMDYVHYNPLKHNLVTNLKDWPFSTFHRAVQAGIYPPDWCGESYIEASAEGFGERPSG